MSGLGNFETGMLSYIGLFIGALLIYEGLWQLLSRAEAHAATRNRRMRMIAAGASAEEVLAVLKPDAPGWWLGGLPYLGRLPQDMRQAGLSSDPTLSALICGLGACATALAASLYLSIPAAAAIAFALWVALPLLLLRRARGQRFDAFSRQLPDALDLMARGLRVGHPLNATIASVAEEMADPIASEFGIAVDQIAYGDTLVDAMADLSQRIPNEDMRYLSSSISIQHATGGDLAGMLETLSRVIRARMALRRKVRAISAEGRLTAIILTCIPFMMIGMVTVLSPTYYGDVMGDPAFKPAAAIVFGLIALNAIVLRRLVNFRI